MVSAMRLFLIAVFALIVSYPTWAEPFADAHARAMRSADRCERAWFQFRREATLKDLEEAATEMALLLDPMSAQADLQNRLLAETTEAFRRCSRRTYP